MYCLQVVAPVRETCAQTIGVILKHTDAESVKRVMMVLLTLQAQEEWEVRENKGDEFRRKKNMEIQSGGEKRTNASGQQGENGRQ